MVSVIFSIFTHLAVTLLDENIRVGDGCPIGAAHLSLSFTCFLFLTASTAVCHRVHLHGVPTEGSGENVTFRIHAKKGWS